MVHDFNRIMCTYFNEASNIAQAAGLVYLSPDGFKAGQPLVDYYVENARIMVNALTSLSLTVHGGGESYATSLVLSASEVPSLKPSRDSNTFYIRKKTNVLLL
ncbi:hypothetical protein VNO77_22273 [Canavalia gladiata]|uniref:Uncharacterized protein n=1 Tax=Canavalia gladiata TaxID=3824 RepID=A0AAN9Q7V8_CANGL